MPVTHLEIDDALAACRLRFRETLRGAVSDSTWQLWLEPLVLRELDGDTLVVEVPDHSRSWVADRFSRLLAACARAAHGHAARVVLVGPGEAPPEHQAAGAAGAARARLNPRFTFDQFVIGDANRLAHAAALAVAEAPGLAYNPLYLCGPPGVGKTHLLHSIGAYVEAGGDGLTVRYTTVEEFTDGFLAALHGRSGIEAFKATHRGVDVLLVDDVQYLERRARTMQEFFHTFNALHAAGAQLVLTSDRLPRDLDELEARLRERFEGGLVVDMHPPDLPTRRAILRKRVLQDGVEGVEPGALALIAERVDANVRALEGALIRIVAHGSLTGRRVTEQLAAEVLDRLHPAAAGAASTGPCSVRAIQERTCRAFGLELDQLLSADRRAPVAWPRQVAMYLARELTQESLPAIGRAFGGRSHTTVVHACRRAAERIAADPDARAAVQRLTADLRP